MQHDDHVWRWRCHEFARQVAGFMMARDWRETFYRFGPYIA